ncbi:MAG TPA: hypothetical protein PLT82_03815 [Candidatus Hydrogenedens sp.]|nr:hypothetical protein [Candidatus Hydrogenedens sp.]HOK10292.1 hypothetical protein [Candidatus Hydrogenedens sp.]HOL19412.1 hypothetical protein [Candidatus Hydrogenedens sp.]HPP58241.1 hypothetical protein [Candidatus Hydrogenedens sp.]
MTQQQNKYTIILPLIFLFLLFNSCSQKSTEPQPTSAQSEKISTTSTPQQTPEHTISEPPTSTTPSPWVIGKITIIDSTGKPLEKMAGIATEKPNAFDEPIARGNLSGPDGVSTITIPKNKGVFIRAWDPILHYFPNNYFEIPPTDADYLEDMQILMLEASTVEFQLLDKDDQPISNENVGLMMFHPKLGPWWPCDAHTDEAGNIQFKPVPAGMYNLRIKTERGMILEIKDVKIPPASILNLGKIKPS